MTDSGSSVAAAGHRSWHRSIAAKLLIAFGLIAALTVGASWLSLIRFGEVERGHAPHERRQPPAGEAFAQRRSSKTGELVASATDLAEFGDRGCSSSSAWSGSRSRSASSGACSAKLQSDRLGERHDHAVCRKASPRSTASSARSTALRASSSPSSRSAGAPSSSAASAHDTAASPDRADRRGLRIGAR